MSSDIQEKRARYFLPEGYECNNQNITFNDGSGEVYWNEKRRRSRATYLFQFSVYDFLCDLIKRNDAKTLVDVGCGVAAKLEHVAKHCPDVRIVGIDQDDAISFCKDARNFGEWYVDNFDAPHQELSDIKGDIVVCSDVIEHVQDPDMLLEYLKGKLSDGGVIVLSTPDRLKRYPDGLNKSGHRSHVREWSMAELANYLEDRGFEVVEHVHQNSIKVGFSKAFVREVINQMRVGRTIKYNQVCVIKVAG